MNCCKAISRQGYSLLELSLVLMVLSMLGAIALKMHNSKTAAEQLVEIKEQFAAIDHALLAYRKANNRLPCPARIDIVMGETSTPRFGMADDVNLGTCSASAMEEDDNTVMGAVPVGTLGLPDSYAFDPWGRKIEYYIDRRITVENAFNFYHTGNPDIGNICVKFTTGGTSDCAADTAEVYRTKKAVIALVSHGENGHGGFSRVPGPRLNSGSVNVAEAENCGAALNGPCSGFNRILIQQERTENPVNARDTYDDFVMYRMRWHYLSTYDREWK